MKKRIVSLLVGICMAATLAGCSSAGASNDKIKIEKYKGLEVEKVEVADVSDEDIEKSIQSTLEAKSTETEITDRPAQKGDVVTVNYEGKKDGVAFDGGTAENQQITLGAGGYIEGFEDGIIGHSVGETFDMNVTFPENYTSKDLAGQAVVFTVTINKIVEKVAPELTDELVAELSKESKTIEEYKKEVSEDLKESNEQAAQSQLEQNVWEALIENCKIEKYPKDKKQETIDNFEKQYESLAQMYGMTDADALVQQLYGMSIEVMAENTIKQEYAVELIAEKEKISISDDDYKEGLQKYAEQFGYTDGEEMENAVGKEKIEQVLLQEKVLSFLVDNCKQVEKKTEDKK